MLNFCVFDLLVFGVMVVRFFAPKISLQTDIAQQSVVNGLRKIQVNYN